MTNIQIPIPDSFNDELKKMLRSAAVEVIQETVKQEVKSKDWLSAQEVQDIFGLAPGTLNMWIKKGLKVSTVGQKRYISKSNLDEFLASFEH